MAEVSRIFIQCICPLKRGYELAAARKKNDCDSPANNTNGGYVCEIFPLKAHVIR